MRHLSAIAWLVGLILVHSSALAQSPPCTTNSDTVRYYLGHARQMHRLLSSSELQQYGLVPTPQSEITVVSDSTICEAAITAYNGLKPGTPDRPSLERGVVVQTSTGRYFVFDPRSYGEHHVEVMIFDTTWALKARYIS